MNGSNGRRPDQGMRVLRVIWIGTLASLGVYLLIAHLLGDPFGAVETHDKAGYQKIYFVLLALAVLLLSITRPLKKKILAGARVHRFPAGEQATGELLGIQSVMQKYMLAAILSFFLSECVGVFGLVLYFLGGDSRTLYLFIAASAVALYLHRPREEELQELLTGRAER